MVQCRQSVTTCLRVMVVNLIFSKTKVFWKFGTIQPIPDPAYIKYFKVPLCLRQSTEWEYSYFQWTWPPVIILIEGRVPGTSFVAPQHLKKIMLKLAKCLSFMLSDLTDSRWVSGVKIVVVYLPEDTSHISFMLMLKSIKLCGISATLCGILTLTTSSSWVAAPPPSNQPVQ